MFRCASSPGPCAYSRRTGRRPGARERPHVRPHRVDVLVDPELLLVLLLGVRAAPVGRARPLVQPGDDAAAPRHARELADHRLEVERVVERRDAEGDVERAVGERQPLAVGLDPQVRPDALLEEPAAAEPDQRVDDEVAGDVLAAARQQVLRGPALRRAELEHAVARLHVVVEQQLEAVLGRRPGAVVPAEVAVEERQRGVDPVVGLVPALLLRELGPAGELAELRVEPGRRRVEQARDPVGASRSAARRSRRRARRRARPGRPGRRRTRGRQLSSGRSRRAARR